MDIFLLHLVSLLHSGSGLLKGDLGDLGALAGGLAVFETGTGFETGAFTPVGAGFDKALEALETGSNFKISFALPKYPNFLIVWVVGG